MFVNSLGSVYTGEFVFAAVKFWVDETQVPLEN